MIFPTDEARAAFNELMMMYAEAPDPIAPFIGGLRSEVKTAVAQQTIEWQIRNDVNNLGMAAIRNTENRLDPNDAFLATHMTVMFGMELTTSTTPGATIMQQFDNPATQALGGFETATPAVTEAYNGRIDIEVNNTKFATNIDMLSFRYVDLAQQGTLVFTASNTARSNMEGDKGWRRCLPGLLMNGGDTTKLRLTLPESTNFGALATFSVVAAVMFRGWRIGNGAGYRPRNTRC